MHWQEYLVSYGKAGEFARFRPAQPLQLRRGDRVVVRSPRGLEVGAVLCAATAGHAALLADTFLGPLLRPANADDERLGEEMQERGRCLLEEGRQQAAMLGLHLEIVDVELALDGRQATVHCLRGGECDERPLVSFLARTFAVDVAVYDLDRGRGKETPEEGCGRPDCGRGAGGCATCGSDAGCSSGHCSGNDFHDPHQLQAWFGRLRRQSELRQPLAVL